MEIITEIDIEDPFEINGLVGAIKIIGDIDSSIEKSVIYLDD